MISGTRIIGFSGHRILLLAGVIAVLLWFLHHNVAPAIEQNASKRPDVYLDDPDRESLHDLRSNISVNLVVATRAKDDISWTEQLQIPNLNIVRYVSDSQSAQYHPPMPKGREALMYFTYLHDFYDDLPDVSIFIHAEEHPWHIDGALRGSMTFALEHLSLENVLQRKYFNLRASEKHACPYWINTSKTFDDWDKREEPYLVYAWQANFGEDEPMPEMIGGPCCSQFAVTRDAIRSRPKEQYKRSMEWMMDNNFGDYIAGRVWEHLWPQLFTRQAMDCTFDEWSTLCRMYSVCFEHEEDLANYNEMWMRRALLRQKQDFWSAVAHPDAAKELHWNLVSIEESLQRSLHDALARGKHSTAITSLEYGT